MQIPLQIQTVMQCHVRWAQARRFNTPSRAKFCNREDKDPSRLVLRIALFISARSSYFVSVITPFDLRFDPSTISDISSRITGTAITTVKSALTVAAPNSHAALPDLKKALPRLPSDLAPHNFSTSGTQLIEQPAYAYSSGIRSYTQCSSNLLVWFTFNIHLQGLFVSHRSLHVI